MRVVFFGTPQFAVPSLAALLDTHDVAAVVTRPDRPHGRGQKVSPNPVKALAAARGIPVLQPTRLNDPDWLAQIEALGADLAVVVAYGRLLPQRLLDMPRLGFINVCLLYTSDAADERSSVDLGGRRIIKKKKNAEYIHVKINVYKNTSNRTKP